MACGSVIASVKHRFNSSVRPAQGNAASYVFARRTTCDEHRFLLLNGVANVVSAAAKFESTRRDCLPVTMLVNTILFRRRLGQRTAPELYERHIGDGHPSPLHVRSYVEFGHNPALRQHRQKIERILSRFLVEVRFFVMFGLQVSQRCELVKGIRS